MKYKNAKAVLPRALLNEIQKYVQGDLLYIPKTEENHLAWGARTGTKNITAKRNSEIMQAYKLGMTVFDLASTYCLSEETIKKIVYSKEK